MKIATNLVDSLALELERPRQLSSRVLNYILQTYGINVGGKQFFHPNIEEMYGGERDQRSQADSRLSAKESELQFLTHLQKMLSDKN